MIGFFKRNWSSLFLIALVFGGLIAIVSIASAIDVVDLWPTKDNKFSLGRTGQKWKELKTYSVETDAATIGDLTLTGAIIGGYRTVTAKTASYTLTANDSGNVFTTVGAAADITITTLATAPEGFNFTLINGTTNAVWVVPAGGAKVGASGTWATGSGIGVASDFIAYSPSAGVATMWVENGDFTTN